MEKKKKNKVWGRHSNIWLVFAIVSVLLIVCVFIVDSRSNSPDSAALWKDVMLGILCSVIASGIFAILQRAYTNDDHNELAAGLKDIEAGLQESNKLYKQGVISIRPKSYFDSEQKFWKEIINNSGNRLDLVGHSLSKWFKPEYRDIFVKKIASMLNDNKTVNIVLSMDNLMPEATRTMLDRVKREYELRQQRTHAKAMSKLERTLFDFYVLLHEKVDSKYWNNLKIYIVDLISVTYLYIRTDTQCIMSPYTHNSSGQQDSLLIELQPGTRYAKLIDDDMADFIETLDPIDMEMQTISGEVTDMRLKKVFSTENKYSGSDWDREITTKYVFEDSFGVYEVGYFEHYAQDEFKKSVIEMPVSFGCPSKCTYCASSNINMFYPLEINQMKTIFDYIYDKKELHKHAYVLLSITGMGDLRFNRHSVFRFVKMLESYRNLNITFSSNFWDWDLLEQTISLNRYVPIRYIQYTYVSYNPDLVKELIPIYNFSELPGLDEFLKFVSTSEENFFRINYIVIRGKNDSVEDVNRLADKLKHVKEKITVRVSKLNETSATRLNNLKSTDKEKLDELKQKLVDNGIRAYVFCSDKNDNMNCGQLYCEEK